MSTRRTLLASLFATALTGSLSRAIGDEGIRNCHLCSCSNNCQKVCRLACEEKKITTTIWGVKCEDFCAPGPSDPDHEHCETIHASPKVSDPYSVPKALRWTHWMPGDCGTVYTKKKLMKKTVTKTIPSYKWVVEDLCPACQTHYARQTVPAGTELPPEPSLTGVTVLPAQFASPE